MSSHGHDPVAPSDEWTQDAMSLLNHLCRLIGKKSSLARTPALNTCARRNHDSNYPTSGSPYTERHRAVIQMYGKKNKLTHQLLYSVADLQIQCTVHWTDLHMQQDGQFPTACLLFIPVHVDDEDYEGERLGSVDASKKYQISCWQIVRNKPTNKRITDISKEWKSTHIDRKSR